MSSQRTPALVVTMILDRGHVTPTEWLTRARVVYNGPCPHVHGKPSDAALAAHVKAWEEATKPGGVNAHIGETKVLSAKIVRQSTQEVLAQYKAKPLCFSCEKEAQKYATGLCEGCHNIAVKASAQLKGEA